MRLSAQTLRAYRCTVYAVAEVAVRIGQRSLGMDALLRHHGARTGVFVTAWNPFSRRMAGGWNRRMQRSLRARACRRPMLPGRGSWRRWQEEHLLVMGDARPSLRLARLFRQHAVVVVRLGQGARLVRLGQRCAAGMGG